MAADDDIAPVPNPVARPRRRAAAPRSRRTRPRWWCGRCGGTSATLAQRRGRCAGSTAAGQKVGALSVPYRDRATRLPGPQATTCREERRGHLHLHLGRGGGRAGGGGLLREARLRRVGRRRRVRRRGGGGDSGAPWRLPFPPELGRFARQVNVRPGVRSSSTPSRQLALMACSPSARSRPTTAGGRHHAGRRDRPRLQDGLGGHARYADDPSFSGRRATSGGSPAIPG